jgi:hypothetical protein
MRLQSFLAAGTGFVERGAEKLRDMTARIAGVSAAWLVLLCGACAGAVSDSPSFMLVGGISASEEMCLTAADGTRMGCRPQPLKPMLRALAQVE